MFMICRTCSLDMIKFALKLTKKMMGVYMYYSVAQLFKHWLKHAFCVDYEHYFIKICRYQLVFNIPIHFERLLFPLHFSTLWKLYCLHAIKYDAWNNFAYICDNYTPHISEFTHN